jgi:hypothetical protein
MAPGLSGATWYVRLSKSKQTVFAVQVDAIYRIRLHCPVFNVPREYPVIPACFLL